MRIVGLLIFVDVLGVFDPRSLRRRLQESSRAQAPLLRGNWV
jgi:hypothetical protein